MTYVTLALRLALAGVFLVSGLAKARALDETVAMVAVLRKRLWPAGRRLDRPASWLLVTVEAGTGAALLAGRPLAVPALLAATALLVGFAALALAAARSKLNLTCACFGRPSARLGWRHVWRNLALLGIAVSALAGALAPMAAPSDVAGYAVAASAALVVTLLCAFYDDIVDLVTG
ncbi:MauE/DoxX family redox-associated membrane protein [Phytohabitans aurantiacus]|uniref:Methylamine utilisation protein MauE domain-containing protein n=1 Tax=Phytohabitans aurantiacus TaxID=3016789 RepID=A0ABQ5QXD6_9ACTN|nr:MauE/DoxX family redox-associated membrane protein [Phytohabitans aurantiacus]GLH98692.1 hypothetical protein Pa4123_39670 [Phytohabitans aurantiacus]